MILILHAIIFLLFRNNSKMLISRLLYKFFKKMFDFRLLYFLDENHTLYYTVKNKKNYYSNTYVIMILLYILLSFKYFC